MSVADRIRDKLTRRLTPLHLAVVDESHRHAGHAGSRPEGETHFRIEVVAAAFAGRSRLERHRLVNDLLAEELAGPVHALAIKAQAPGESV
jgi:Stress-induced morphogen (activity unknown)